MGCAKIHIGHHFFGAGNVGDDLMMAGFLTQVNRFSVGAQLTCSIPFPLPSQQKRFPGVQWYPYDRTQRERCIRDCDVWLGLGDTPFQMVVGPWFLDHLVEDMELCQHYGKPMYFLGVGVNDSQALQANQARKILDYATHVWTRDALSAQMISQVAGATKVTEGADLAHLWLRQQVTGPVEANVLGYTLNFELAGMFSPEAMKQLLLMMPLWQHRWLIQEVRKLPGSELSLLEALDKESLRQLRLCIPDYQQSSMEQLLNCWGAPEVLVSSRYHCLLAGAWAGCRMLPVIRSEKLRGICAQLDIPGMDNFLAASTLADKIAQTKVVSRERLQQLGKLAEDSCWQFYVSAGIEKKMSCYETVKPVVCTSHFRPQAVLASVAQLQTPRFQEFMARMNHFAQQLNLRTFTNWSKVWEYPWLWFAALHEIDWRDKVLVDVGSELSPFPWYIGTLGARVELVETSSALFPMWQKLAAQLHVNAGFHATPSEQLPLPSNYTDVLTSFSVIEHQPDKKRAVDEVIRVLKPGGIFAVSFDICEPDLGMSFPAWNGHALTLHEFEEFIWRHPALGSPAAPHWNTGDMASFKQWHLQSAPHHNYVVGGAVLRKEPV